MLKDYPAPAGHHTKTVTDCLADAIRDLDAVQAEQHLAATGQAHLLRGTEQDRAKRIVGCVTRVKIHLTAVMTAQFLDADASRAMAERISPAKDGPTRAGPMNPGLSCDPCAERAG